MGGGAVTLDFFRQEACWTKQLLLAGGHWMLYYLRPIKSIHRCDGPDSICGPSFVLIGQKLRPVSRSRQTDRQTDRQTNKQTDKRTYLQISSKFWQVINWRQKWINRVQNSPVPLILGRRLRIWGQIKDTSNSLNFHKMAAIFMQK